MSKKTGLFVLLVLASPVAAAEKNDPCAAVSSVSDVQFSLALKDHGAIFQAGEIIPLALSFTSSTKDRYTASVRSYDRSGRLFTEDYCVDPAAPDPLESYFKVGGYVGGGLGGVQKLDATPFTANADLNEWRTLEPGHYRVYAISYRVGGPSPDSRIVLRSNNIEIEVTRPDPAWQAEQLRGAAGPLAARTLRFLNTKDSTRELARQFWGLNSQSRDQWNLMFGLYGSPYRRLAIDSMHAELAEPGHAITEDFLRTLVNLQVTADPSWERPERQAHVEELMKAEIRTAAAALPQKVGSARALTLYGLLSSGGTDQALAHAIRPALIAAWNDLPPETRQDLLLSRWPLVAGPEMLPILRRIVSEPPPPARTLPSMTRDAALKHIYDIDPAAGRDAILRDVLDVKAEPALDVVALLSREDLAGAIGPAVERVGRRQARVLDYELIDRYAGESALEVVQAALEPGGRMACTPQSALLRYLLRVAPESGAQQTSAALNARKFTACYKSLLQDLGAALPKVQQIAINALDDPDPELARNAAIALGHWASSDAEKALWRRLQSPREANLEQGLVAAIAQGRNWICPPDRLAKLDELVAAKNQHGQIAGWIKQWQQGPAFINPAWSPDQKPVFSLLQYDGLTEDQLQAKIGQLPRGTQLRWQFWPNVNLPMQEEVFERMAAAAAQHGLTLESANPPR